MESLSNRPENERPKEAYISPGEASSEELMPVKLVDAEVTNFLKAIEGHKGTPTDLINFKQQFSLLAEHILEKAKAEGLPGVVQVNFDKICSPLFTDPKLDSGIKSSQYMQYFVESTVSYLCEIHENCKEFETSKGALKEVIFSDGDPHLGKRPCFITFERTDKSGLLGLKKTMQVKYAYKPRALSIEKLVLSDKSSLFQKLNQKAISLGITTTPPFRTREIITRDGFGLHEFVPGEALDPTEHGLSFPTTSFGKKMVQQGIEKDTLSDKWLFMEQVLESSCLGSDAHYANFIFNSNEGYVEPIDLEVYNPSTTDVLMPSIGAVFEKETQKELESTTATEIQKRKTEIRNFFMTECGEELAEFHKELVSGSSPHIRCVPINTSIFAMMIKFAANDQDFATSIKDETKEKIEEMGFQFIDSPEIEEYLLDCYGKKDIPIFLYSSDMTTITMNKIVIGELKIEVE